MPQQQTQEQEAKHLLAKYHTLPPLEQRIMQIRALTFRTSRKSIFTDILSKSDLTNAAGKRLSSYYLTPIIANLTKLGLLDESANCPTAIACQLAELSSCTDNQNFAKNVEIIAQYCKSYSSIFSYKDIMWLKCQETYLAIYTNNSSLFTDPLLQNIAESYELATAVTEIFYAQDLNSSQEWVKTRHPLIQIYLCYAKLCLFCSNVFLLPPDITTWCLFYRTNYLTQQISINPFIQDKFLQIALCMGEIAQLQKYCTAVSEKSFYQQSTLGTLAFINGDTTAALTYYKKSQQLFSKLCPQKEWGRSNDHQFFYFLALLITKDFATANKVAANLEKIGVYPAVSYILESMLFLFQGNLDQAHELLITASERVENDTIVTPLLLAFIDLVSYLLAPEKQSTEINKYKSRFTQAISLYHYLAAQIYAELVLGTDKNNQDTECNNFLDQLHPFGPFRFLALFTLKQPWEYAVDKLNQLILGKETHATEQQSAPQQERRLAWLINPERLALQVVEQKLRKGGGWSGGKNVALKRLYNNDPTLNYLTEQDRAATAGLRRSVYGWYNQECFTWDNGVTFPALIGHPLLFHLENPAVHLELVKGDLELQVEKTEHGYHLSLSQHSDVPRVFLERESANRYRVVNFLSHFVAISKVITAPRGIMLPLDAKDKVIEIIRHTRSDIRVISDIDDDSLPLVSSDATCCLHLFPVGNGIKINLWIKPFGEHGHYYRPATGQKNVIATTETANGEKIKQKALRDFSQEQENALLLINSCPTLLELNENSYEWHCEEIKSCLEILLELEEYKKHHSLHIEWPQGETLKLKKQTVSFKNLSLSIKGNNNWFEYAGEVKLDNNLTLDMKNLLELLDSSNNYGRFVKLADGEFIALTEKLKKHLEELKKVAEENKVYNLGTKVLCSLAEEGVKIKGDKSWREHVEKLTAMEKYQPAIPLTLQAQLREYQQVGFTYLSRLTHWGIGACLADDMGVGKTVQTIAVLLERAALGAALVVAPTSVCFIWAEELAKFSPSLSAHTLNSISNPDERKKLVDSMGEMDVLICSYNLLAQAEETLGQKEWQIVVLDEAQAIKNSTTKRWKCATQLKCKSRIALTGTPIENHLGELWSIFRFLNPGLLGSLNSFQERYSYPIEKNNDAIAKRALKNLVTPYILRRTKNEVLQELPLKTEQSILVEPSDEELAFYEALRAKALERIEKIDGKQVDNNSNATKKFSILAEISRLRQACCHSSLVDEKIHLENSKIKVFLALIKPLIENHHRALIFSQYVRYLDKIKEVLHKENISYQYLDGATPMKARTTIVEAFQSGEGELFLISLKAGGIGLNLTAADYVIILDPWWNPAVEDQAADRAHRIGQQRPVTVYRLIMKHTIEEKIVKLHQDKKDLANDLLSGGDISGKITEDELLQLMRG